MEVMRLVITGPVGAGKTTFIQTVSEIAVVDTDRIATDKTADMKQTTTVALDFGKFTFGTDKMLYLYGTPGQARFDFMWDLLIQRAHAYLLLVAAHRPEQFRHARQIIAFMAQRTTIPMMIGVTHTDCSEAWTMNDVGLALGRMDDEPPMVQVNPNDRDSTIAALIALVEHYSKMTVLFN